MTSETDSQIILEITSVGHSMEVRAVAPDGLEVAFVAPVTASEAELTTLARAKLDYVRRKTGRGPAPSGSDTARKGRGGILV